MFSRFWEELSEIMSSVRFWMALSFILATCLLMSLCGDKLFRKLDDAYHNRAWCSSLGGYYGGGRCFKDGVEIRMEE